MKKVILYGKGLWLGNIREESLLSNIEYMTMFRYYMSNRPLQCKYKQHLEVAPVPYIFSDQRSAT